MHRLAVVLGLVFLFSTVLLAQGTGSISGIVQDASGAVVPGANVTVTNSSTGVGSTVATDATGGYHFPILIPGTYEVKTEISGFQTEIRRGVDLPVGSDLVINVSLKVGQVTQQEVVNAEALAVDTASSSIGTLVEGATIRDLPLNGRSFDQLITLDSSTPTFNSRGRFTTFGEASDFSMNGAHTTSNLFMMDGTEMQGAGTAFQLPGGILGINLGVDAIQEFQVLSSNYTANYGKKAGGIINIATRSGTNQIHGSAFEFLRNSDVDARNFYDGLSAPPLKRSNFGGAIGGPIKKDKSFFFGTYEGVREQLSVTKTAVVPDANAHQGLLPCAQATAFACNPSTGLANVGVAPSVAPYLNLPGLFPLPNGPSFGDGTADFLWNPLQTNNLDFFLTRFDQQISAKDSFFARYNFDESVQLGPAFLTQTSPLFYQNAGDRDQMLTLEWKRLISPRTVNLFREGFSRGYSHSSAGSYTTLPSSLYFEQGAPTIGGIALSSSGNGNVVANQGLASISAGATKNAYANNLFDETEQLFHYVGGHSLLFGVQFQRNQINNLGGIPPTGSYTFSSLLNFLEGTPKSFSGVPNFNTAVYDTHKSYRRDYFDTYIQDDYKLTRTLTLNLGLRYELWTVPSEVFGRLSNYLLTEVNGFSVVNPTPEVGGQLYKGNHLNFAPRFGFAWDPSGKGKMSVRGGFGLFYDNDTVMYGSGYPFSITYTVTNPSFPNAFATTSGTAPLPAGSTLDPNQKTPTRMQFSLGIQRQITSSSVFNIGYVGSNSRHLALNLAENPFTPEFLPTSNCQFSCSAFGQVFYPAGSPRLQPLLNGGTLVEYAANGSYNSLQTDYTQRLSHGLRYKLSYTFSKSINISSGTNGGYANGELGAIQDPYNVNADKSLSPFNQKHSFAANYTYDIPWNRTDWSRVLLGNWQLGGIITVHTGTPFTATDGFCNSRQDNSCADRPSLAPGANGNSILGGPNTYFNSSVFVLPPAGYYGNVDRNTLTGPGFFNMDFTLHKGFSVTERIKADLRFEFFNILNHPNFDLPSAQIFSSTGTYLGSAGHIADTVTTSRQLQGAIKFTF